MHIEYTVANEDQAAIGEEISRNERKVINFDLNTKKITIKYN